MHICKYCKKEFDKSFSLGGHVSKCDKNPNYVKNITKLKKAKTKERITIKLNCKKCDEQFEQLIKKDGHNYIKLFCSRSCANSRKWSDSDKLKKSISVKQSKTFHKNVVRGSKHPMFGRIGKNNPNYGRKHSVEMKDKISKSLTGRKKSKESKLKSSIWFKEYYKKYPERHPNRLCAGKKSYWQTILYENIKKEIPNIELEQRYDNYWMDITEPFKKINIEYDGQYYHDTNKDKIRDNYLISKGWKILRISSNELNYKKRKYFLEILDRCILFIKNN